MLFKSTTNGFLITLFWEQNIIAVSDFGPDLFVFLFKLTPRLGVMKTISEVVAEMVVQETDPVEMAMPAGNALPVMVMTVPP